MRLLSRTGKGPLVAEVCLATVDKVLGPVGHVPLLVLVVHGADYSFGEVFAAQRYLVDVRGAAATDALNAAVLADSGLPALEFFLMS